MKKVIQWIVPTLLLFAALHFGSCKSKPNDAEIKAAIETALKADPMSEGTVVSVEKGIATLSGECKDESCKAHCAEIAKAVKGVKEVVNNCTIAPAPPPPVQVTADDPLKTAVTDALKDFPSVQASIADGIVTLTGEINKADLKKVMMALSSLKPKKIDASALVKK